MPIKTHFLIRLLIIGSVLISIYGCAATSEQMHAGLDPWIGQKADVLISQWGAPSNVFKTQSGEYTIYTWLYNGGSFVSAAYYPSINMGYASAYNSICRIDWTADRNDKLVNFRWEGECRIINNNSAQQINNNSFSNVSSCQNPNNYKVAILNSESLFEKYQAKLDAQESFNKTLKPIELKADSIKNSGSAEEYKSYVATNFGSNGFAVLENEKYSKIIVDTMNYYLDVFFKSRNEDFVVDIRDTTILYHNDKLNIVDTSTVNLKNLIFKNGICNFSNFPDETDIVASFLNKIYFDNPYIKPFE